MDDQLKAKLRRRAAIAHDVKQADDCVAALTKATQELLPDDPPEPNWVPRGLDPGIVIAIGGQLKQFSHAQLDALLAVALVRLAERGPECDHQAGCPRHGDVRDCEPAPAPTPEEIARHKAAKERHEYIAGLRMLADLLQSHPELELPYTGRSKYEPLSVNLIGDEGQRAQMAAWARALPGKKDKAAVSDTYFRIDGALRGLGIRVLANRAEVCEKRVIGTQEVTEEIPDPEAVAALPKKTVTRTEEIVEWVCGSVLDDDR